MFPELLKLSNLQAITRIDQANGAGKPLGDADEKCSFVMISNWTTDDDDDNTLTVPNGDSNLIETSGTELYWGYGKTFGHQLFAGRDTILLPCQNLSQISIKARKGQTRIYGFTFWF
jgi:hypothetical protein